MTDVQMDYEMVEEMSRIFDMGAQTLDEIKAQMMQIADMMENGALLGEGGRAFADALQGPMANALGKLSEKFEELSRDCYGAVTSLRDGDTEAASRFA